MPSQGKAKIQPFPSQNSNWDLAEASFGIEELMFELDRLTKIYLSLEDIFRA